VFLGPKVLRRHGCTAGRHATSQPRCHAQPSHTPYDCAQAANEAHDGSAATNASRDAQQLLHAVQSEEDFTMQVLPLLPLQSRHARNAWHNCRAICARGCWSWRRWLACCSRAQLASYHHVVARTRALTNSTGLINFPIYTEFLYIYVNATDAF
jgi:hypothetical protein